MVELLAPAGTKEAFKAAVEAGANAVYLAGKDFGARAYASNFDLDELKEAVKFAHLHNTLVHVTVNTLIDDTEMVKLASYLQELYDIGVDAIIVQDLGVAKLAKKIVPNLPLHASTQLSTNSLEGVNFLKKLGFSRVVLAREVSLENIRYICQNSDVEIEVFVHGAICVCYSGQCLMSSMIGGRSGNRGRCAQPCRLPYTLINKNGKSILSTNVAGQYLLSPRDMKTIELIPELIKAKVVSFKIEGRMKKPEYVAIVVDAYRKAIDKFYQNDFSLDDSQKDLAQIFNRDFTTAYLLKKQGKNMISDKRPNNRGLFIGRVQKYDPKKQLTFIKLVENLNIGDKLDFWVKVGGRVTTDIKEMFVDGKKVSTAKAKEVVAIKTLPVNEHDRAFKIFDSNLNKKAEQFFLNREEIRPIVLSMSITAHFNEPVILKAALNDNISVSATSSYLVEKAKKTPSNKDLIFKQLNRLGNTVYSLEKLTLDIDDDIIIPASILNDLRRNCVEQLDKKRLEKFVRPKHSFKEYSLKELLPPKHTNKENYPLLISSVNTLDGVKSSIENGCDEIIFGGDTYNHQIISSDDYHKAYELCKESNLPIYLATPRILRQEQLNYLSNLIKQTQAIPFDGIYVHNPSICQKIINLKEEFNLSLPLYGDFSFNVFNTPTIESLKEIGFKSVTISPELNLAQIKHLAKYSPLPLEVIIHGNIELMVSEYCVLGSFLGNLDTGTCSMPCKKDEYFLQDRKNELMPIKADQFCHMHILNSHELSLLSSDINLNKMNVQRLRIDGRYIHHKKLGKIIFAYQSLLRNTLSKDDLSLKQIEGDNFTRGHFFRGVINVDGDIDGKK